MAQASLNLDPTVKNVESFDFEPIKGYPMLQWKGKRPFRSTHYYPAQHKETHGEEVNGWLNQIFWGDNLQVMSHLLKKYRGQIKLIYIDPPFDSKADYKKIIKTRGKSVSNDSSVFEDKQYSDIWTNDEYLQFIYERLILIRELLSNDGSVYVHCDFHKSHHIRLILDEVFGSQNFINELVWKRRGGALNNFKSFGSVTDTLFLYSKTSDYTFNTIRTKDSPEVQQYIKERFVYDDGDGRLYSRDPVTNPSSTPSPSLIYEYKGYAPPEKGWAFSLETMKKWDEDGKLYFPPDKSQRIRRKTFLADYEGQPINNIWSDIYVINSQALEAQGYPTQKPEALLERIIRISSNEGDIVFDCFMGSGTTQSVATQLGRRFIGADINLGAVQITTKRLLGVIDSLQNTKSSQGVLKYDEGKKPLLYTGFSVYNVNHYDVFRNPTQAKDLLIEALELQPLPSGSVFDAEEDGFMVKIMPVNRIAMKSDLRELVMNIDQREWMRRREDLGPNKPVEHIRLICMGHDPDLGAELERELSDFKLKVEVVDILRDRGDLEFKRDSQADVQVKGNKLVIRRFYPMNLLQKLSLQKEKVGEWRELVESVMIDFNYDGAVLQPQIVDIPSGQELVKGEYAIPDNAGTIRVKITDLLSESLEMTLPNG